MDLFKLEQLKEKLKEKPKDKKVLSAIERLLSNPSSLDFAIDLLGITHECNWLPNRKRMLWSIFDNLSHDWISRCLERVIKNKERELALYSLLNSAAIDVLSAMIPTSPDIVLLWDVKGSETTGVGLASRSKKAFKNYLYIGWKTADKEKRIVRIDFASKIPNVLDKAHLSGAMKLTNWIWAELPYRFSFAKTGCDSFDPENLWITRPFGNSRKVVETLLSRGAQSYL